MSHITWINVNEKRVTGDQIKQLEQYLKIKFPNDFIECVQKYDGGYPTPDTYIIPNQDENSINNLLTLDSDRKETFLKQVTAGENSNELNEGLEVFFDLVELIDVLKAVQE
ncbi:SMI1/KNR4 family protein [Bacillus sp. GM_Baccil_2]|uniref:SMI1/KNR4 family protein n=1 Tax=Bacillus sp. GM_Baccil_2 TaxID=2937369 RepID=UPI002269C7D4